MLDGQEIDVIKVLATSVKKSFKPAVVSYAQGEATRLKG
jgi:hypothetical protein